MSKTIISVFLFVLFLQTAAGQEVPARRAESLGLGMNLSYLDRYWNGTKEKGYSDFADPKEAEKRRKMLRNIAAAGFESVRLPVCFSAWATLEEPYAWRHEEGLKQVDRFVGWALESKLRVVIDLHHPELGGDFPQATRTERMVWLWREIAARYRHTDPDRVFFELRNEPHGIEPEKWRGQARRLIGEIRKVAPDHTLIVGFHDWNSRRALLDSEPFADGNLIYTFHYYDPFIFTHQGATWAGDGLKDLAGVPFPWSAEKAIKVPATTRGTWVEPLIESYRADSDADKMFEDLKLVRGWADRNDVPVFLGEFGSYSKNVPLEDRCRHASVAYAALGRLRIPSAWWEWDGGFSMFAGNRREIPVCMKKAINAYRANYPLKPGTKIE